VNPVDIACPEPTCRAPAWIVDRWTWNSSDGLVEHVKTGCQRGHWFTHMVESLNLEPVPAKAGLSLASVP
jgi:hypothetical protein